MVSIHPIWALMVGAVICSDALAREQAVAPASMRAIGTVDGRFQSYNIEMVEVTGGRFWRPYPQTSSAHPSTKPTRPDEPALQEGDLYAYRPPIDLDSSRLRTLAAALAPAYLRVSGTWANATYFADGDDAPPGPPAGFSSVLSRARWRAVIDFAREVDAQIVTSFAVSAGTRDAAGLWTPDQARHLLAYTRWLGASVAAAEFMNEPTLAASNGAPAGYDAKAYGRDFKVFRELLKQASPGTLILGPGSVGESSSAPASGMATADILIASGGGIDGFSYHHYSTVSRRCGGRDVPGKSLSDEWLARTDRTLAFYRSLRDRLAPQKPLWLTETAAAACGGNPWDATFMDTFRYLDQLGRLAKAGVQVVLHNTLAASDYGLLDEGTFVPRPNYWGALLWRRLMGRTVLDPGVFVSRQPVRLRALQRGDARRRDRACDQRVTPRATYTDASDGLRTLLAACEAPAGQSGATQRQDTHPGRQRRIARSRSQSDTRRRCYVRTGQHHISGDTGSRQPRVSVGLSIFPFATRSR